jgi:beta-glucanase (GH16 family)
VLLPDILLNWDSSTDDVAVTDYNIYRNNIKVGTSITTSFTDTGLTPSTAYSYIVKALDAARNESTASNTVVVTTKSSSAITPLVFEDFHPWSGAISPNGIWRIAGTWPGTGGNTLQPGNVAFTDTYPGDSGTGFMYLTVPAGSPLRGAELQSLTSPGYGYGYYEARIKSANVAGGGVVSFFWVEQPGYGPHEWDVEFTLSDSWAGTNNNGRVSYSLHPNSSSATWINLGFNPSQTFHRYGFLWVPGRIDFTVDGKIVHTETDQKLATNATGFIMVNTWSGTANFGGGPPAQAAISVYDWVKFYPGATSIVP